MFAETQPEAFNINSLFVDSRQIVERPNGPKVNHVISKKECQRLYPHHDGVDGESFYELLFRFRDRHFAEKLISSCDFDFSLALRLGTLCHGNIFLLKRLSAHFSSDLSKALRLLNCFPSSLSSSSSFLLSSQFLSCFGNDVSSAFSFLSLFHDDGSSASRFLSFFHDDVSSASSFFSLFNNDISSASSFLSIFKDDVFSASSFLAQFNNDVSSASSFLTRFNNDFAQANDALDQKTPSKFTEESSFKLALFGCNGDISAVEAFSRLSGIKHLELLYDSEQHPHNAQEFHSRCDNRGPTVTFICANGSCVCGVVNASWSSPPDRLWVSDSSAFLLRLSPNPQKFPIKSDQTDGALYCTSSCGPSFGYGCDLGTSFTNFVDSPKGMYGWVISGYSYDLPKNDFLLLTCDGTVYPIDRIVVCNSHNENINKN